MGKLTSRPTDRPRRPRRRLLLAIFVPLVLGTLAAAAVALTSGGQDIEERREAISKYQKDLFALTEEWGRIEILGMRPAIGDLSSGEGVPAETIAGEARAWQAGLRDLRKKIVALDPPAVLERAEDLFDEAIARYIDAAVVFEQAADGPVERRKDGIEEGRKAVSDGARLYNEASLVLQRVRKSAGLSVTPDFPNHPAGQQDVSNQP